MITKNQKIIVAVVIGLAVLTGAYFVFKSRSKENPTPINDSGLSEATTTTTSGGQLTTQGTGTYKIEQVAVTDGKKTVPQPIPNLNRPVVSVGSKSVAPEALVVATEKIGTLQSLLKKDPSNPGAWVNLGIYQKMAGDYEGTVISWIYATKLAPSSYVAFGDLGDLYAYFLKDNALAEMYYKLAISKGPTQAYLYTQLAEVYRDIFKDINKARAIVAEGLSKIPDDANLLRLKASLK